MNNTFYPLRLSVSEVVKQSIKHGDILLIYDLKTQQNESLQHIAKCMNDSFGIVMNPPVRMRKNRKEVRLEWIGDRSIKAGIKLKYVNKAFPNIYIHRLICAQTLEHWTYITGINPTLLNKNKDQN